MRSQWYGLVMLSLAGGCYLQPGAVKNPQPSPEGIAVKLIGQDCEDHRGGKGDPVSREMGVKLRIDNPTDKTLHIAESQIRLTVAGASASVRSPTVVEVKPRGSATLEWDFTHHALCEPNREFVIVWNDALVLDDHPIAVANLAFNP